MRCDICGDHSLDKTCPTCIQVMRLALRLTAIRSGQERELERQYAKKKGVGR